MDGVRRIGIRYEPLPTQRLFHGSRARFKGFSGPVGSGKSQALVQEVLRMAFENPGRWGLVGAPTYAMLRDTAMGALLSTLEENGIEHELNKGEMVLTVGPMKSRVLLRTLDEPERLRGTNLAWFGVDELTYATEEAWTRLEARLRDPGARRLGGFGVWTPRGFDWVHRRFVSQPVAGYEVFRAQPFENRFLLDKVPDYYQRLEQSYDGQFYQQEVLGEYLNLNQGAVYHAFDRTRHVEAAAFDSGEPLLWAMDFNVDPMCSVVGQRRGERLVVLDEIVLRRATTEDAVYEFLRRYPRAPGGLKIYGDASGGARQTTGSSDYDLIRQVLQRERYGRWEILVDRANPSVRERVGLVNSLLKNAAGAQRITVAPRCRELIVDLEQVVYKADSGVIDKERDPMRTHLSDALGYLAWAEYRAKSPVGFQYRPLF